MKVDMHEYGTAQAPEPLQTTGLGPCIGVAIVQGDRGFLLHSPDVIMERESVIDPFFALLDAQIPKSSRQTVIPVVAGGCLDPDTDTPNDREVHESTLACRADIVHRLTAAGFSGLNVRWAKPHEIHSLFIDLGKRIVFRETVDMRDLNAPPCIEVIRC